MRDDAELQELLPSAVSAVVQDLLTNKSVNFCDLAKRLELNPAADLRHGNFACCDFSNCDLSGFDFTGSDLTSATGINVKWDRTTNFTDVDASSSIFAYKIKEDLAMHDPNLMREFKHLIVQDWATQIIRTYDILNVSKKQLGQSGRLYIATRIFFESTDLSVKTNILMALGGAFAARSAYFEFLLSIFARQPDRRLLQVTLRGLKTYFKNRMESRAVFLNYLSSDDEVLRHIAQEAIISSKFRQQVLPVLVRSMRSAEDELQRRLLTLACARELKLESYLWEGPRRGIDYLTFSADEVKSAALYQIRTFTSQADYLDDSVGRLYKRASLIFGAVEKLKAQGLPFEDVAHFS